MKTFNAILVAACAVLTACNSTTQEVADNKLTEATPEEVAKVAERKKVKLKCTQQARLGSNIRRTNCRDVSKEAKDRERRAAEEFMNETATAVEVQYGG
ncbi:hypothetical protein [Pseudoalteromonas sp. G4]|uniref:hypothetical protein n=1 Tax=Pseudoalteromonas sp. G4 TaxID=2992761 RepID=UPI00237E7B4F|nr:hypothetical protein [Pseudoalteromonas sp. G4]MDE3274153.1 hypothetical protein [Pseudoalteromonas sp. G4]